MDLADATAHRAVAYVAASQRQGYVMTVAELEAYLARPMRRPGTRGRPGGVVMRTPLQRVREQYRKSAERALALAAGGRLEREEATPGTPAEPVVEWLTRLSWLRVDEERVRTTPLGDAMLAHLEQASLEEEIPVGVVLDQGDELATARVISQIAEVGQCAVVDPFFSMNSLLPVVHSTQVEQVLTGTGDQAKLAGLEVALHTTNVERSFRGAQKRRVP